MFGSVNQRRAIDSWLSGVHTLTATMKPRSTQSSGRVTRIIAACSDPSVFRMSHVLPRSAYATTTPSPVNSGNGATQSNGPPAKARSTTGIPWM